MNEAISNMVPEEDQEELSEEIYCASEDCTEDPTEEITQKIEADEAESITDADLRELKEEFPELCELESITELSNPIRYAALRELGLSPAEAYILTSRRRNVYDTRSHLKPSVPVTAKSPSMGMSSRELQEMRNIFGDMSDSEIHKLYKKVTK